MIFWMSRANGDGRLPAVSCSSAPLPLYVTLSFSGRGSSLRKGGGGSFHVCSRLQPEMKPPGLISSEQADENFCDAEMWGQTKNTAPSLTDSAWAYLGCHATLWARGAEGP